MNGVLEVGTHGQPPNKWTKASMAMTFNQGPSNEHSGWSTIGSNCKKWSIGIWLRPDALQPYYCYTFWCSFTIYACVWGVCVCVCGFCELTWVVDDSEKMEVIFKNHFITILFPVDRFGEMGPSSRTFFSDSGFTCSQLLDHIYAFYQVGSRK